MKKSFYQILAIISSCFLSTSLFAQVKSDTSSLSTVSLQQCIGFALRNQPVTRQASLDEQINERNIGIALADWLPQVSATGNAQHYFQMPVTYFNNNFVTSGAQNSSTLSLQANQVIYNSTVALAARTSKYSREYYKENTLSSQINVVSDVSKAFYDVLLSQKQLSIINEDIIRLQRSLKDAYAQYQGGIVDKIDYKQATIALNNELSSRKQSEEAIHSKIAYLKQIMGFAPEKPMQLAYDSTQLERETLIDTNQVLDVNNRIEYKLLSTQKTLQNLNVDYYKWNFLPSVSAFGNYNLAYFNPHLQDLYTRSFPNSLVGLNFSIPIFQGTKRLQNLSKAKLQVERADLDLINTRNVISTQYTQALAGYKSNYNEYKILKQNVELAKDVYNVVSLQYREGIKTYLNVINAQSDLRTSELNYYNALFNVLSTKIDLQKSLGTLSIQY
ncbi:TolC family protein [Mucilaginibacter paludis]|uniref:Outer membrane efflux protein n=1 Tax=Mucilaginibacter paludis DSM 18603 TaxID=714943 RepID=H1Y1C0_9SPHI|nr:TolC family protein [Mucilaginibacter paludis]EHQ30254.1 outer membrane efflux protein [Mucilaginibacter paludis DSM 18603]